LWKEDVSMMQRHRLAVPDIDQFAASGTAIKAVVIATVCCEVSGTFGGRSAGAFGLLFLSLGARTSV
jgi:hypothetical protein